MTTAIEAWVQEAHRLLVEVGPQAVTVEGVARRIGVTKGSFYWHFRTRADLLAAALGRWEREQTTALIQSVDASGARGLDRLAALFELVTTTTGGLRGEAALYADAPADPLVRAALTEVTRSRLAYVAQVLTDAGMDPEQARDRARLALSIAVGQRALALSVPDLRPDAAQTRRLTAAAVALFAGPPATTGDDTGRPL